MRYPVGWRDTWEAAYIAARESANMTGIRYRVHRAQYDARPWGFVPVNPPQRKDGHMPVMV